MGSFARHRIFALRGTFHPGYGREGFLKNADLIFVGAGLANSLLAYRLKQKNPSLEILLLEAAAGPRADRTWSFYESDVSPEIWAWLSPLAEKIWPGYDVKFPKLSRGLDKARYASLRGETLLEKAGLLKLVSWNTEVSSVEPGGVTLASGEKLVALGVVDGRGQGAARPGAEGYQKFFGLQVRLKAPHGITRPVVMDATVPQDGGYRFFYLLPWDERRLLVEDTYYANDPSLDRLKLKAGVEAYIKKQGWEIEAIEGEEASALPIPYFPPSGHPGSAEIGVAAGLFHPVTGYSVPYAAAVAERWDPLAPDAVMQLLRLRADLSKRHSFYYLLNRMLFLAADAGGRRQIFEKFYGLPEGLAQRFYAGRSSLVDQALILSGRPPVAIAPAIRAMFQKEKAL
ncbi:MAG: lycopene cyclase [Proteobacteria bacterium]|nr:MAG: lycopene cyclase [Pseudomonadota bacterium]